MNALAELGRHMTFPNTTRHAGRSYRKQIAMSLPQPCAPPVPMNLYYGAESVSINFTMAFWGITCTQTFLFFINYPTDTLATKALVLWLWIMNTTHQCLLISGQYTAIVASDTIDPSYTSPPRFIREYLTSIFFTTAVSVPTQAYFAYRIHRFSHSKIITGALVFGIFLQLVGGVTLFAVDISDTTATQVTTNVSKYLILVHFTLSAILDIALAFFLCYFLWSTYFTMGARIKSTGAMLQTLTFITLNTGFWTAAIAVITATLAFIYPANFLYISFYFLLSPLYCNSLLCSLNTRTYVRSEGNRHRRSANVVRLSALGTSQSTEGPVRFRPIKVTQSDSAETGASTSQTEDAESASAKGVEQYVI
ncbi:hypothetical protein BC629DRAFT_1195155 [Irpex lacteus]|nr:hypothetical protein BC629DRAFT_1195155 [Irpex lacteus]